MSSSWYSKLSQYNFVLFGIDIDKTGYARLDHIVQSCEKKHRKVGRNGPLAVRTDKRNGKYLYAIRDV